MEKAFYLLTGVMASGKSTLAEALARRLHPCVHIHGDWFRRMIVSGRADMSADPDEEALRQLYLRYRLTADTAKAYFDSGFSVVAQDNYYGRAWPHMLSLLRGYPVRPVVLCPRAEVVRTREQNRGKTGYTSFTVQALCESFLRETPRLGLWLDTSELSVEASAGAILRGAAILSEIPRSSREGRFHG